MKSILHILSQADLHVERGSYSKARKLYNKAYQRQKRELGVEHDEVLVTLYELGLVNCALGRTEEASEIFADLLEKRIHVYGEADEYVREIRGLMAEGFADNAGSPTFIATA